MSMCESKTPGICHGVDHFGMGQSHLPSNSFRPLLSLHLSGSPSPPVASHLQVSKQPWRSRPGQGAHGGVAIANARRKVRKV